MSRIKRRSWAHCGSLLAALLAAGCHVPQASSEHGTADSGVAKAANAPSGDARERVEQLAPLPKSAITEPDADQDHIRDDVELFIDGHYAEKEGVRLAARQFARAEQHGLAYARDPDRAQDAGDEITRAIECLYAYLPADDADAIWKELQARTLDSDARAMEYFALQDALAGGYFESSPERAQACAFDITGIAP